MVDKTKNRLECKEFQPVFTFYRVAIWLNLKDSSLA